MKIVHLIVFLNNQSQQVSLFNNQSNECISFDVQTLRIRFDLKRKEDILLVKKWRYSALTNRMSSFQIKAKTIRNVWTWSIYRIKKITFNPFCFNIHFADETINGSHITITTATLRLCTNYTPDLCNVFCNLLGNKLKKWFELLWKGTKQILYYLK